MEITIDYSIYLLEDYYKWKKKFGFDGSGVDDATNKLLEVAKKYQKIEQIIMDDWDKGFQHSETLRRIREVIEDGDK